MPVGTTVFDDEVPGVAKLDPALLAALRRAATDAAGDGVEFVVNSGWRSKAYEERLRQEAVSKYGGRRGRHRVLRCRVAVRARRRLRALCQIYRNEPWHYELRPEAIAHGCPPVYADPTHDPRMQQ